MLGTLQNKDKSHWKEFVKPLVHAYNCMRNDVTGFSPYKLMFYRQPRLPVDLAFGLPSSSEPKSHSQYVHDLKGQATKLPQRMPQRQLTATNKGLTRELLSPRLGQEIMPFEECLDKGETQVG